MTYIVGLIDGEMDAQAVPDDELESFVADLKANEYPYSFAIACETHSVFNDDVELKVAVFQKGSSLDPETAILKLTWVDSYTGDEVLSVQGTLSTDENNLASIVNIAQSKEEFAQFDLYVGDFFADMIEESEDEFLNAPNGLGRNFIQLGLPSDTRTALSMDELFDAVVEAEDLPNYLCMFFNDNVQLFQTMLRISEKLNVPLYVELDPTLLPEQHAQIAEELGAYSHRVTVIANAVLARPNSAETLRGKKKPRYALGTLIGYTLIRNANTDSQGFPPIQNPVAGYGFPMRWPGMEMRQDVKYNEETLEMLAKAKVNMVLRERYDTGPRFVLADVLTQYDSKTSVLRLTNSSEISMFIDNRLINICKRHLLKAKTTFKADALRECRAFLEGCGTAGLIVESADLGGKYTLDITDRADRPHDAVDLKCGYRPEGTVRAVYLATSVHK
jgi:hypothetical protein